MPWKELRQPGGEYLTENLRGTPTNELTVANGWPTTDGMVSTPTTWTEVPQP